MKPKKILITGANGYVGSTLVRELCLSGKKIGLTCIDDFSRSAEKDFSKLEKFCMEKNAQAVFAKASVLDFEKMLDLLEGIDIVVHLAYVHNAEECEKHPDETRRNNVEGTKILIKACEQKKIKRLIFPSSILVYGAASGSITEKTLPNPITEYGRQKLECEKLCLQSKLDCLVFRKANIFGTGFFRQPDTVIPVFIRKAISEKKIQVYGPGEQEKNFLHIMDAMQAYKKAIFSSYAGLLNIGGKKSVKIIALAEKIAKEFNAEIEHVQPKKPEPKNQHIIYSSEMAKKSIGYAPKLEFEKSLEEILKLEKKSLV